MTWFTSTAIGTFWISELGGWREGRSRSPCEAQSNETADFVLQWGNHECNEVKRMLGLPVRPVERPYLAWWMCHNDSPELRNRKDFIWFGFDLRDYNLGNNSAEPLRGVTLSSPRLAKSRFDPAVPPKYFLTFRGSINQVGHSTRTDLSISFKNFSKKRPDVQVHVSPFAGDVPSYWQLMNSSYVLVPRGHGRWSYRFGESLGCCAIPVVMSDGWELPLANIINWTGAVIVVEQSLAKDPEALLQRLPTDTATIRRMRERACAISDEYFKTEEKRFNGFLRAARAYMRGQRTPLGTPAITRTTSLLLAATTPAPAPLTTTPRPTTTLPPTTTTGPEDCEGMRFYFGSEPFPGVAWRMDEINGFTSGMSKSTCRTNESAAADFVLQWGFWHCDEHTAMLKLPVRPVSRPYVGWWMCHQDKPELRHRRYFIFFAFDLRTWNLGNDTAEPLRGVAISSPRLAMTRFDPAKPPKYFLTFRGTINQVGHTTREDLNKHFKNFSKERPDVQVMLPPFPGGAPDYWHLMDTAYALVPRGHGRWSYRFGESLGCCAIPVVMSDGWTLPLANIINWSEAAIVVEQKLARDPAALLKRLPSDPATIRRMRERACAINDQFFATEQKRFRGFLLATKAYLRGQTTALT